MSRSPFTGTFQPNIRPTVVTAPDAVVYINGEQEVAGCPQCHRTFNLNKYITSIQVDLNIESVPGTASVSLSVPRHSIDEFYFDGNPVITTMMEIEIYAKGYYLVEGIPQYYPIFWGIITEVSDNYSNGEHTVNISANDILKWWDFCSMNINPAYTAPSGMMGRDTIHGNVFTGANPYDIIFTLAFQSFGDIIIGTGSAVHLVKENLQKESFSAAFTDMMRYWERRFTRMRNNLVLYGTKGVAVRGDTLYQKYYSNKVANIPIDRIASQAVRDACGGPEGGQMTFDATSNDVAAYRFVLANAGSVDLWQSEFQTKTELANAAKEAIGFEFYMDVTGDIVFKPPFYNLDVIGNKPVSWIQDIDVLDWNFSEAESEVVTQLILQGQYGGTQDYGLPAELIPYSSVTDYHLLRKYGWRSQNLNSEFIGNLNALYYWGLDRLDRKNSHRHRGSITIPLRPELRLGFPVYVAPKDQVWYLLGISHSIQFGGRATTNLTLTAKRSKFIAPQGMGTLRLDTYNKIPVTASATASATVASANQENTPRTFRWTSREMSLHGHFKVDIGTAASIPPTEAEVNVKPGAFNPYEPLVLRHPKTGRIVGYPNVVMVYTRPFVPADISAAAGEKEVRDVPSVTQEIALELINNREQNRTVDKDRNKANKDDASIDRYLTNRYQYGLNSSGVYIYAHDTTPGGGVISEIITLPSANLDVTPESSSALKALQGKTALIRPVSDERGFEVVGHYQYGRRVSLRDGRLVVNDSTVSRASVDVQLALSGSLQATLTAASQGLNVVSTGYADPARTLSTLTADDVQTASTGTTHPDTNQPVFIDVGNNYIDSAPLGSDTQDPKVEATQLSRALTLMEMSVKDSSIKQDDCVCFTGRPELLFMNSGYQVKTLSGTQGDFAPLTNLEVSSGPISVGAIPQQSRVVEILEAELKQAQDHLVDLEKEATEAVVTSTTDLESDNNRLQASRQAVVDQKKVVESLAQQLATEQKTLMGLKSQYSTEKALLSLTPSNLISKVDEFLYNLYKNLDTPHQEFEKTIRGDYIVIPQNVSGLSGEKINPPSEMAPPFSAPNRFMLGDPKATVGALQSNAKGLKKAWKDFGSDLKKNAEKTHLEKEIQSDKVSIIRLRKTREQLISQRDTSTVIKGNVNQTIKKLDERIAKLEQNVADNQTKLTMSIINA